MVATGPRRSISSRRWSVFALLLLSVLLPRLALADYPSTYFAVKCDSAHNRVLIRFVVIDGYLDGGTITPQDFPDAPGTMYEVPSLPTSLKANWKGIPYNNQTECTLKDGQKISLSQESSVTGPGTGEWIADVSFTMKINDHFTYIGYPFFQGSGRHPQGLLVSAVEYTGKKLLACYPAEKNKQHTTRPGSHCVDESDRLLPGYKYLTQVEKNALERYRRKRHLAATISPLCYTIYAALTSEKTPDGFDFYFGKKHILWDEDGYHTIYYSTNRISLINNKTSDYVVEFGFFNKDNIAANKNFLFNFGKDKEKYESFIAYLQNSQAIDLRAWYYWGLKTKKFTPWKEYYVSVLTKNFVYSGVSDDWLTYFLFFDSDATNGGFIDTAFGYRGNTYIFTMPNSPRAPYDVPTSVIAKLLPDKSVKIVCAFTNPVYPDQRF